MSSIIKLISSLIKPRPSVPLEDDPDLWFTPQKGRVVEHVSKGSKLFPCLAEIIVSFLIKKEEFDAFGPEHWLKYFNVRTLEKAPGLPPEFDTFLRLRDRFPEEDGMFNCASKNYYPPIYCPKWIIIEKDGQKVQIRLTVGEINELSRVPYEERKPSQIAFSNRLQERHKSRIYNLAVGQDKWIVPRKKLVLRNRYLSHQQTFFKEVNKKYRSSFEIPYIIDLTIYSFVMHRVHGKRVLGNATGTEKENSMSCCQDFMRIHSHYTFYMGIFASGKEGPPGPSRNDSIFIDARKSNVPKRECGVQVFREFSISTK